MLWAYIPCYQTIPHAEDQQSAISDTIKTIESSGAKVVMREETVQRFAVIDHRIVWYGSIDFLAYARYDADVIRFESSDVAGELEELVW